MASKYLFTEKLFIFRQMFAGLVLKTCIFSRNQDGNLEAILSVSHYFAASAPHSFHIFLFFIFFMYKTKTYC